MLNAGDKSTQKRNIRRALKLAFELGDDLWTKAKAPLKLVTFDSARCFDDDEAIAEYMTALLETNDPDLPFFRPQQCRAGQGHGAGG